MQDTIFVLPRVGLDPSRRLALTMRNQLCDCPRYFNESAAGCYHVEHHSAGNMKRTFVDYGLPRDWFTEQVRCGGT